MMLLEIIEELENKVARLRRDAEKFDRGNASAGTRVRKDLMDLVRELKEVRQTILDERKSRKE
jgi:hypothetical protein